MSTFQEAEQDLLRFYSDNDWFTQQFWPENRVRTSRALRDAVRMVPPKPPRKTPRVLDVGCHNGFASFLFARTGYRVTACDALDLEERKELLKDLPTDFHAINLNAIHPFSSIESSSCDIVFAGEIFEHILNHPLGLLEGLNRVLRSGGILILTTPNPANAMNAVKLLAGSAFMRGTRSFAETAKFDGTVTADPRVHYREYTPDELEKLLDEASFSVRLRRFFPVGTAQTQSLPKRIVKKVLKPMFRSRLLAATQYVVAQPAETTAA